MRVLIVDDERLARRRLHRLLLPFPQVEVVRECRDAEEAIAAISSERPDAVFLDVQMPGRDGLEVVRAISPERLPPVVFVTAYDAYAVAAFEVDAVDYLLKPIDAAAVARAVERLERARPAALARRLEKLLGEHQGRPARKIALRERGRTLLIQLEEVDWVGAEGNYVRLHAGSRSHLMRSTLQDLEGRLDPARFLRLHRSTIVNVDRVTEVEADDGGDLHLTLRDGTRLSVSRRYRAAVRRLLDEA